MKYYYECWLEWSIIISITSGENVTLSILFQCRWLKLYMYFDVFLSEYYYYRFISYTKVKWYNMIRQKQE